MTNKVALPKSKPSELFNALKDAFPISLIIKEYMALEDSKIGEVDVMKGDCPFCKDDKKSFSVAIDKDIFYCFQCHLTGDVISFLAKKEGLTQMQAATYLLDIARQAIAKKQALNA